MNEPGELDPALVAARRALLDALQALESQRAAVIVAGAQAIYMHTGEADVPLAPFTIDGDIVLDVGALLPQPTLADAMKRARFELGNQPGRWIDARGSEPSRAPLRGTHELGVPHDRTRCGG